MLQTLPPVEHYYQSNVAWTNKRLGRYRTIGQAGCAMTCGAMLINYLSSDDDATTPLTFDKYLDDNGGYSGDLIKWEFIPRYLKGNGQPFSSYTKRQDHESFDAIIEAQLSEGNPLIAGVSYGREKQNADHYVLIVGRESGEDGIKTAMLDPGTKRGNYYEFPNENIIEETPRKGGYFINRLIYIY